MKNGDKYTGEINKLENGILYFKAGYMADSVQLDWARVDRLHSLDSYNVVLANGTRSTGLVQKTSITGAANDFTVTQDGVTLSSRSVDVITIVPVENTFWHQLVGAIDYGLSYTGGTQSTQSNFSGDLAYRSARWAMQLNGSSVFGSQEGAETTGRNTLDVYYFKYRGPRWFVAGTFNLLNSRQQELDLRTSIGGGLGRDLVRRSTTTWLALCGVVFSREKYTGSSPQSQKEDAELHLRMAFSKYTFKTLHFTSQLYALPNLSTRGRVRMGLQLNLMHELVRNLYWKFSLYENYDNRPPVNAPKNDFGATTSIGWKF